MHPWEQVLQIPPHSAPALMLPMAPLGPAVPPKLLKRQSWVASPAPQGWEGTQLFLSPQPQGDHQFSKAGAPPGPSHNPEAAVRVVPHMGTELPATGAAKLHLPRKAPSPATQRELHIRGGQDHSSSLAPGQRSLQQPGRGGQRWGASPALTQHRGSPAPNAEM